MASHDAVAAVGRTLQALLHDRLDHPNGADTPVPVTLGAPGPERDPEGEAEAARANLFLYQVAENGFLANQDLPGVGHPGAYGHPPLSLTLHFLLTVFGSAANGEYFDETPAHLLLGSAMRVLHDHAIVTEAIASRRPPTGVSLLDPALRGEHEHVKLTVRPLGLEDLSNVWTALALPYRLSVAYEVSVVLVESTRPRRHPRPVQEPPDAGPRVHVATLRRPRIASVAVRRVGEPPDAEHATPFARVGDTLVLRGGGFDADDLVVRVGPLELAPEAVSAAGGRVEVTLPDTSLPDGAAIPPQDRLRAGPQPVTAAAVVPGLPGAAVASGQAVVVVVPGVTGVTVDGRTLTVQGTRLLTADRPGQVIVGDAVVERRDYLPGSDEREIAVVLPDTLPAWPAAALVSGELASIPDTSGTFDLDVSVDGGEPVTATLAGTPTSLAEAAGLLQDALRAASPAPALAGVRVAATDLRLVVVPGGSSASLTFAAGALADALALSPAGGGAARSVYLSGALAPFPALSNPDAVLDVTIGTTTERVALVAVPASIAEAAELLEAAVRAVPEAGFDATRVTVLADQLCVVPPAGADVAVTPAAGADDRTAAELQLAATYPVRVRASGVESIDEHAVELPS